MELDVSYDALMKELEKHGPEVKDELYNHLLEARRLKNSALSSIVESSHNSSNVISG